MSSINFSIDSYRTRKSGKESARNGNASDSDSDESEIFQSTPAKRNREKEQSLVVGTTAEELKYRRTLFPFDDYSSLKKKGLACAACGCKIPVQAGEEIHGHLYLQVAVCKKCKKFYGKGDFSVDEDGTDKFCRLCGNGGDLFCCSTCTCVFCKKCVKQNVGRDAVKAIEREDSWDCYICDIKPLWELRAFLWGAKQYVDTIQRTKKQKVNATLLELSDKKRRPPARRTLARRKDSTTSESEDEARESNSDKENPSSSDGSMRRQRRQKRPIRKLFTQPADDIIDISTQSSERESRRKSRKGITPSFKTPGVLAFPSDSDSENETGKVNGLRKKSAKHASDTTDLTDAERFGEELEDKLRGDQPPLVENSSKKNNTRKRKKKKKNDSSSENGDSEESEKAVENDSITSKFTDCRPAAASSIIAAMSGSESDNSQLVLKKTNKSVSKHTDPSDESNDESVPEIDKQTKKKPAFFESQAKEYNTGKRKKKKGDVGCTFDEEKEMDSGPTVESISTRHTSSGSDSVNSDSEDHRSRRKDQTPKRSTRRFSKKGESSGDDEPKPQSSNEKTRKKLTKTKMQKKQAVKSDTDEESRNGTHVGANIDSESDYIICSFGSKDTVRRDSSKNLKVCSKSPGGNKSIDLDRSGSINCASKNERRSSCDIPDSPTKKVVNKRSASADDALGVDRSDSSKKAVNTLEIQKSDSENSDSDEEMPLKVDRDTSEKIMAYMQKQCYVSNALGKSLCKVTKVIESKIKSRTDFQNTRNIDKMFNRMIRMSKSVKRNAKNLQTEFLSKYKNWKKEARCGNGSASKSDYSIKQIQEDIAAWEAEFREWPEDDSSDDKPVKSKKSLDLCERALPRSSTKKSNERVSSTDINNVHSEDVEDESQSLLAVANQDVEMNECASVSSNVTQLYDYKKTSDNLKSTEVSSKDEDADISGDMFSDSDADKSVISKTKKSKSSKKDGSKLKTKTAIDSDESDGNAGEMDGSCAESLVTEGLPVACRENSASPTADVVADAVDKKSSDSECKVSEKRKSGPKSKCGRSPACPMSKRKKITEPISAEFIDDVENNYSRDSAPEEEVDSAKVSSSEGRSKSKDSEYKRDSQNGRSLSEELSPDKAKALLLATSSEDEPLKKSEKSKKSVGKPSSKSQGSRSRRGKRSLNYTGNASVNKNVSSSDTDDEGDVSDLGKLKKRSPVKNRPKKKLNMKSQSKLNRRLLRSFNDERLVQTPIVELRRLQAGELLKYGITEIPKKKKNSSDSESDSTAIARLVNLKSAGKRNRQKRSSGSSSSGDDLKRLKKKNKVSKKETKKAESAEVNQAHSGSEDGAEEALDAPSAMAVDDDLTEQELKDMNNRLLKEKLLASSSDDDADEPVPADEPKEKTPKKDSKEKVKDDEKSSAKTKKKKKKKDDDSDDKKGSGSDSSDILPKKKQAKRSRLFKMRLSVSDSSEEEAKFKAKEARRKEEKENAPRSSSNEESDEDAMLKPRSAKGKSPRGKKIKSDSDESVNIVESSSTNSDDDFVIPSKNKRKGKSSGSDSSEQKKKKTKRRRIKTPKSDSDSDIEEVDPSQTSTAGKGRKNIRKVMTEESVGEQTKRAAREELERKKRIEEKQILYNKLYGTPAGTVGRKVITEKLVLDFDPETKEELVKVHESIVRKLKPHQVCGVEFMWNVCYESVKQLEKNKGAGCILAHCMGLGKSFQVVALVHTLLSNPLTKVKTVLVVCPLSTALNWVNEFSIWLKDTKDEDEIDVFELSRYKKPIERMHKLQEWQRNGGVMVMNYELYRTLSMNNVKKLKKTIKDSWARSLVDPGPDLVVCDEGHLLKNEDSAISKAMRKVRTLRRIVLTGTPLQNNLVEYHCMVNFVRPNLLGTRKEFLNRFVNPITNGQYEDSTAHDVKVMKRRAHVLHKMLDGIVQRYDYAELTPFLPEKQEYVISVRLSEPQIKIYQHFLDNFSGLSLIQSGSRNTRLLPDWHVFQRINTHPKVMLYHDEGAADKDAEQSDGSEGSLKDFIDDGNDTTSESSSGSGSGSDKKTSKPAPRRRLRGDPEPEEPEVEEGPAAAAGPSNEEWWSQYCTDDVINGINSSGKLAILFSLLRECETVGDKVLVFSQSLFSLRLIEDFLERINNDTKRVERERKSKDGEPVPDPQLGGHSGTWVKGYDYFRLDGSISAENRNKDCKRFNNKNDHRSRLYLISTRAGGLGINLVAANRVVVFDASWNPSHDVQSIFRVFRFGQTKPCYIYRLLAYSTIEERVYERQVTKLSLSCRVVDEQQIDRHYSNKDIMAMYTFDHEPKADRPTPILPKDRMLAELLKEHGQWIETYHEHDSLLENKADEELNEEERKAAWEEYESLKKPQISPDQYMAMFKNNPEALRTLLRSQNPDADEAAIEVHMVRIQQMVEVNEQRQAAAYQQRMLQIQQQNYNYMQQQYQQQQNQQMYDAVAAIKYPMKYPTVSPAAYQQQLQFSAQKNPILNTIMTNQPHVKIPPPAPGKPGAGIPRISVRSVAEMQMPRAGSSHQPALNPYATGMRSAMVPTMPGMQRSLNVPPPLAHRTALPAVSLVPITKDPRPQQKSGAPMSPINLD